MRCDGLKYFQDELETATHAPSLSKGPIRIREISVLIMRLELDYAALVKHRSVCLMWANAPIERYVMQP